MIRWRARWWVWVGIGLPAASPALELISTQVGPHSYYVQGELDVASAENRGFNANAGFVVTPQGVVVFDALGTPALGQALVREIRRRTSLPIRYLILSHYHADHAYGAEALRAAGAQLWMHREARHYLDSPRARERLAQRRGLLPEAFAPDFTLPLPDRWLDADERLELGGVTIDLRYVGPAHAPDDLVMLVPEDGVLFSGDLLFVGRIPTLGEAGSRDWLRALERLDDAHVRVFVPGHGPASTDFRAAIDGMRTYLLDLRAQMAVAVQDMLSFEDAYRQADWRRWRDLPAFEQAHRANAYTVFLELERESLAAASG
ncbi:MBL fold metallo-hydrolase [Sinimarinibacterium thermocellulolyticum]|uniref:MBL fold metallo-hydrolase n=1 Tax=Sinimarinibacterium thermocellulolyticum TaxID=3170016 RepID=A0ABV2ABT4_9GAMM